MPDETNENASTDETKSTDEKTSTEETKSTDENTSTDTTGFTQEDIDRIVTERLKRDRESREADAKREAELAAMDDVDRAKAEAQDAVKRADEQANLAHEADRKLDLIVEALAQGIDGKAIDRDFLALVGAFSSPDELPKASIAKLLAKFPQFKGEASSSTSSTSGNSGGEGSGSKMPSREDYNKMGYEERTKFWNEHPETARQYHEKNASAGSTDALIWQT